MTLRTNVTLLDWLYTYREIRENGREMWKMKSVRWGILCHFFHSSHFTSGSALAQKLKGFRGLFFRSINKTQNSHEMWKMYCECCIFRGVLLVKCRMLSVQPALQFIHPRLVALHVCTHLSHCLLQDFPRTLFNCISKVL